MKVGAHPMVVAVALGLLGPNALAETDRESEAEREPGCEADELASRPAERCGEVCACFDREGADPLDVAAVEAAWTGMVR
jgi:hypothetical protein